MPAEDTPCGVSPWPSWPSTFVTAISLRAEFESRYPKLRGYAHHIYVDGFDMPVLNVGPSDPAPTPTDGA